MAAQPDKNKPKLVLSVESATKVLLDAGFEYDWAKGDSRFRFSIPNEESAAIEECSTTREEKIRTIATYILSVDPTPSWRRLISALDHVGDDNAVASKLYEYAEPILDPTLTPENIAVVLEQVENWKLICKDLQVPIFLVSLPKIILAKLIVERYDVASWLEISSRLFQYGEQRAVDAITKQYLPISFQGRSLENNLTLENMCHSLDKEKWYCIAEGIHIPNAKRDEIWHQFNGDSDECSKAAWKYWLENHPAPSWERIAEGLFQIWEHEDLKKLEQQYPTVISPAKRQIACQRAITEKGVYHDKIAHGVCCGFPRAGKSSFKDRLVGRYRSVSDSTGVADKVMRIEVVSTVLVEEQQAHMQWTEIGSTAEETTILVADKVTMSISKIKPTIGKGIPDVAAEVKTTPKSENSGTDSPSPLLVDPLQLILSSSSDKPFEFPTIVAASQGITSPRNYDKTWTHYMSDVGGQLEFQELYPNLLTGPSLYYYNFKANQKFNEKYDVEYVLSGKSTVPYVASTTTRESILQFLASIASIQTNRAKVGSSKPKVLFIATHIDKLASGDDLSEIDRELQQIVRGTQAFKDDMIVFSTESCMLFPIDNRSKNDEKVQSVRSHVNEIVTRSEEYHFDIPYTWSIFSFTIQKYSEQVIPYSTCSEIGKKCGIDTDDDLNNCLWYLHHRLGILRYYEDVPALNHLIFKDVQYIFDMITKLVNETFTFKNVTYIQSIREAFVKKGIFDRESLQKIFEREQKSELISSDELIELLKHLRILAAYHEEGSDTYKYFLPCSLVHADIEEVPKSSPDSLPSLHFTFEIGFCPIGLFGAVVANLLLSSEEFDYDWCFDEHQVYRNQIIFLVGPYTFRFTATPSFISVDVLVSPVPRRCEVMLATICCHVKTRLSNSLENMTKKLNYDLVKTKSLSAFKCPGFPEKTCHAAAHSAVVKFERRVKPYMLKCPYSQRDVLDLPHNYKIWFEEDFIPEDPSNGRDLSPEGTEFKLLNITRALTIVPPQKYMTLALSMGVEEGVVRKFEHDWPRDSDRVLLEIVSLWVHNNTTHPRPSWQELENVLDGIL